MTEWQVGVGGGVDMVSRVTMCRGEVSRTVVRFGEVVGAATRRRKVRRQREGRGRGGKSRGRGGRQRKQKACKKGQKCARLCYTLECSFKYTLAYCIT